MDGYLKAAVLLQTTFDHGRILEIADYWRIRMNSSGVIPVIAIAMLVKPSNYIYINRQSLTISPSHGHQVSFPDWFFENNVVNEICELSNVIIWAQV